MDYTLLKKTSKLKQCSGEDLIYCERKFKEPFSFRNYAKMMFLTNQVPLTWDKTYAFYRRIFLLEFPYTFIEGETADPMIVDKISGHEFQGLVTCPRVSSYSLIRLVYLDNQLLKLNPVVIGKFKYYSSFPLLLNF